MRCFNYVLIILIGPRIGPLLRNTIPRQFSSERGLNLFLKNRRIFSTANRDLAIWRDVNHDDLLRTKSLWSRIIVFKFQLLIQTGSIKITGTLLTLCLFLEIYDGTRGPRTLISQFPSPKKRSSLPVKSSTASLFWVIIAFVVNISSKSSDKGVIIGSVVGRLASPYLLYPAASKPRFCQFYFGLSQLLTSIQTATTNCLKRAVWFHQIIAIYS